MEGFEPTQSGTDVLQTSVALQGSAQPYLITYIIADAIIIFIFIHRTFLLRMKKKKMSPIVPAGDLTRFVIKYYGLGISTFDPFLVPPF